MNIKLQAKNKLALPMMLMSVFFAEKAAFAQSPTVRSYATRQGTAIGGISATSSSNLNYAVDNDPSTSSNITLDIGVLGSYTQFLDFNPSSSSTSTYATTIPANTPITIKFSLPAGLLGALGGVEIQAITNLQYNAILGWGATNVGSVYSGSTLLGLLSGEGTMEYTITPNAAYQGIRIKVSGLASVGVGMNIYDAYVKVPAVTTVCNSVIDELDGVRAGAITLANATGSVNDPLNAIDNSMSTYAELNTGAQVLSQVYETAIFNTPSKIGDSVVITIQDANSNLLNLSALTGLQINLYNGSGATPVQTIANNSSLLTLNLLNPIGNIQQLNFVPTAIFDRVELVLGGVASAFQTLRVYEMSRKNAGVSLTGAQKDLYAYAGQNFTLGATSIASGDLVNYFDALSGGNQLTSNIVPTSLAQSGTVVAYYAGTSRNGCSEGSDRKQINGHIIGFTKLMPSNGNVGVPYNSSVAATPDPLAVLPFNPAVRYSTSSTLPPGLSLVDTTGAITGIPLASGTYPLDIVINDQANNLPVGTFAYDLVISSVPLASNLISFSGSVQGSIVALSWTIATASENKAYEIERSFDGRVFSGIGSLNNSGDNTYSFIDKNAAKGINYYRLKVMEVSGKIAYSNTISVVVNGATDITVFPNPVEGDVLYVKGDKIKNVAVSNSIGQIMDVPLKYNNGMTEVQTRSLNKGLYMLNIEKIDGTTINYRFIIK